MFFKILLIWAFTSLAYIIIAITMPVLQTFSDGAVVAMAATSNMSSYAGTQAVVQLFPLFAWFIPGGIAIVATIWMLKHN